MKFVPTGVGEVLLQLQETIKQLGNQLSQRLDFFERSMDPSRAILPSSIHVPEYLEEVLKFYDPEEKQRRCCLTKDVDAGPPEGMSSGKGKGKPKTDEEKLKQMEYVIAAHLIRTSDTKGYLKINSMHPTKETITSLSPRASILLTKKFEFLFDLYFWALLPENPLLRMPHYKVHVFVKKDRFLDILRPTVAELYQGKLDTWIDELQQYNSHNVRFTEDRCPSFRAVSEHAQVAVSLAKQCGWIGAEEANALKSYTNLSPVHSRAVSDASGSEAASQ